MPLINLYCTPQLTSFEFEGHIDSKCDHFLINIIQGLKACEHLRLNLLGEEGRVSIDKYFRNRIFSFKTFDFYS